MPDSVTIFINSQQVTQFSGFSMSPAIDVVGAGFSFNTPFFPEQKIYRDLFRPFSYHPVEIHIGGNLVLTGVMEGVSPSVSPSQTSVNIQGRSKVAVIVDCTFEKSDFPVQFTKAKLDEITKKVVSKFGLIASFPDGTGALFEEAGPKSPTETVFSFLHNLARQRQLLMSQTPEGNLLFRKANTKGKSVATLAEGQHGVIVSGGSYNGTARFSSFDAFGQESGKNNNFAATKDPALSGIIRPKSVQANDTNAANIQGVSDWAASAAVADSINVPLQVEGWLRPDGKLWQENDMITLVAPSVMIYKPFPFLIKSLTRQETTGPKSTVLSLMIPGAYSGELPKEYPWDE